MLWFGAYNVALNAGERLIDAGTAAMLVNVAPITIALLAAFVLRERIAAPLLAGLAVAFAGAVVIGVGSGRHHGGRGRRALCGLAALFYTVAVIIEKPVLDRASPIAVTWGACLAGTRRLPAVRAGADRRGRARARLQHAAGRLPRRGTDRDRLHDLGLRAVALDDGAPGRDDLPGAAAGDRAELADAERGARLIALGGGALCLCGVAITRRRPR